MTLSPITIEELQHVTNHLLWCAPANIQHHGLFNIQWQRLHQYWQLRFHNQHYLQWQLHLLIIHAPPTMKATPPHYPSPTMAAPPPKTNKADRWGRSTRVSDACIWHLTKNNFLCISMTLWLWENKKRIRRHWVKQSTYSVSMSNHASPIST